MTSVGAGARIVAQRYARALLDVVVGKKVDPERVGRELEAFDELLGAQATLRNVLSLPTIAAKKRVTVLEQVVAGQGFEASTVNLLRLLTERERMRLLGLIREEYQKLLLEHQRIQPGEVTSSEPLAEEQRRRLSEQLGKALGKTMVLDYEEDPKLVGGIVVRVRNRVYDASVSAQLRRFKEKALSSA